MILMREPGCATARAIEYAKRSAEHRCLSIYVWRKGDQVGASTIVPEGAKLIGTAKWIERPSGAGHVEWLPIS
jgi:hypothetical protein